VSISFVIILPFLHLFCFAQNIYILWRRSAVRGKKEAKWYARVLKLVCHPSSNPFLVLAASRIQSDTDNILLCLVGLCKIF